MKHTRTQTHSHICITVDNRQRENPKTVYQHLMNEAWVRDKRSLKPRTCAHNNNNNNNEEQLKYVEKHKDI